jgi:hypothetical protein
VPPIARIAGDSRASRFVNWSDRLLKRFERFAFKVVIVAREPRRSALGLRD